MVHHGEDHRDVPATEGQQLDGPQVGNGAVETGSEAQAELRSNSDHSKCVLK